MKKMNNKGFSLVELIIVIAIMAILAGAIAPALIRYIDKSRKSNDVSSCKTIKTAIETALGNETVYEYLTAAEANGFCYIYITPGESTSSTELADLECIEITGASSETEINGKSSDEIAKIAENEIATNIGEKTPKLKYRKNAKDTDSDDVPVEFVAVVSKKGTVYVFIAIADGMTVEEDETVGVKTEAGFQICPNVCDEYQ